MLLKKAHHTILIIWQSWKCNFLVSSYVVPLANVFWINVWLWLWIVDVEGEHLILRHSWYSKTCPGTRLRAAKLLASVSTACYHLCSTAVAKDSRLADSGTTSGSKLSSTQTVLLVRGSESGPRWNTFSPAAHNSDVFWPLYEKIISELKMNTGFRYEPVDCTALDAGVEL